MKTQIAVSLVCLATACHRGRVPDPPPVGINEIEAHVRFLADDLLGGRGVGQPGLELAALYQESHFRSLGLRPAFGDGYRQRFALRGSRPDPKATLEVVSAKGASVLGLGRDFVVGTQREDADPVVEADLVYCGFGIQAPGRDWDDFKGRDLAGKVLLVQVNEPGNRPGGIFDGPAMTYHGRWTYKFEQAERLSAAGVLIIHDDRGAGYGWDVVENSWSTEDFVLAEAKPRLQFFGWLSKDAAGKMLDSAGHPLDGLRASAEKKEFSPVDLGVRVRVKQRPTFRPIETENVAAVLPAKAPSGQERFVILSAHFDHLGTAPGEGGDRIYNGAVDNCSATATLLALARYYAGNPLGPPVSLVFVAVSAEESGLLGSKWFAEHLPVDASRVLANLNLEMTNVWGETEDVYAIGARLSDLDGILEQAAENLGLRYIEEQATEQGFYYRSDQLSFARVGIPSAWLHEGLTSRGPDKDAIKKKRTGYRRTHYHKVTDEVRPDWDLAGTVQIARWAEEIITLLARQERMPRFLPSCPFHGIRKLP